MRNKKYSKEDLQLFTKLYPTTNNYDLAAKFNTTYKGITSLAKRLKITKSEQYKVKPINSQWNDEKDNYLRKHYPHTPNPVLAKYFNTTVGIIKNRSTQLGLLKSTEYMATGPGRFEKCQIAWNKGKKGYMGPNKTSFKKGSKPHNTKHDHCVSIRKDSSGRKYKWIRVSEGEWQMLHVYNWEKLNGPNHKIQEVSHIHGDIYVVTTVDGEYKVSEEELLSDFLPVHDGQMEQARITTLEIVKSESQQMTSLSDILMKNIEKLQTDSSFIEQAKAINESAKNVIEIKKTQVEMLKILKG